MIRKYFQNVLSSCKQQCHFKHNSICLLILKDKLDAVGYRNSSHRTLEAPCKIKTALHVNIRFSLYTNKISRTLESYWKFRGDNVIMLDESNKMVPLTKGSFLLVLQNDKDLPKRSV